MKKSIAVPIIIVLNIAVFFAWHYSKKYVGPDFMPDNFLVSWTALTEGRYWVLLTSVFSHNMLLHLFINMFVLNSFGSIMERTMGTARFVAFYLIAGTFSSFCHAFVSLTLLKQPDLDALGASGAIAGVILLFSLMFPKERILIFGIIPVPAIWGALAFIGLDVWGLFAQAEGGGFPIGHGAHLGGSFMGIVFYFLFYRATAKRLKERFGPEIS